jgi:hypothetical protein
MIQPKMLNRLDVQLNSQRFNNFKIVSKRGWEPGESALYRLSRPRPDSLTIIAIPLALAM